MAKVTVLMPTYNVAPFVKEAVESVLRQTYTDFELLVIDDCSKDNTVEVVRSITDPRIRVEQNERNLGLADNLNRGLSLIDTEYVARMDGDDIAEPFWLEKEIAVLDSNPEIGVCSGGFERFGTVKSLVRFPETHEEIMANMLFECTVIVPTFRMSLYRDMGMRYKSSAFPAEDYRFWSDCLRVTKLYNVQETVFHYRMHPTQICSSRREEQEKKVAEVRLFMLDWLCKDFTEGEKHYYVNTFVKREIDSKEDLKQRKAFARLLLKRNKDVGHFDETALSTRFEKHLKSGLYSKITKVFFQQGYSPAKYLRYLLSGLALKSGARYETKFLLKSLLWRKV